MNPFRRNDVGGPEGDAEPGRFPHPSSEVRARYPPLRNRWRAEHPCRTPRCTVVGYLRTLTRPLGSKTVEQVRASTLDRLAGTGITGLAEPAAGCGGRSGRPPVPAVALPAQGTVIDVHCGRPALWSPYSLANPAV